MLVGLDLPLAGRGTEAGGLIPTVGQLSESEEKHLRQRVKRLICGSLNGMRLIDNPCHSHTYAGQECTSPGRGSGWELEFRDCGAFPV